MNIFTGAIGSFIRFDVVVFNTLEYTINKDNYDINAFKARKDIIKTEISNNTPLKNCLDSNGEAGKNLMGKIEELLKNCYSDESSIIKLSKDGNNLKVDTSQAISIFENVLPIHEEMKQIVRVYINAAQKENMFDEPSYNELIEKTEYYYRGLVNMLMFDHFESLFEAYNKARREANGANTPKSDSIQNTINRLVKLFNFVKENAGAKSNEYYEMIDPLFALFDMTCGRRELPEGKTFNNMFTDVKAIVRKKVEQWELAWKSTYDEFIKHFPEKIEKMQKN